MNLFANAIDAYFRTHPTSRAKATFEELAVLLDSQLDQTQLGPKHLPVVSSETIACVFCSDRHQAVRRELHFQYRGWFFTVLARPWPLAVARYNKGDTDYRWIANTAILPQDVAAWVLHNSRDGAEPADYDVSESSDSSESSNDIDTYRGE